MGVIITTRDTDGVKGRVLAKGEFGYDDYSAGDDIGRVSIGTGSEDIPFAQYREVVAINDDIASVNLLRADKYLASQQPFSMIYADGKLTKVQYNASTDVEYEVLGYTDGKLTTVEHYLDSTIKGTTTLSYTDGKLVSAIFMEA